METVNIFDVSIDTVLQTIGQTRYMLLALLIFAIVGIWFTLSQLRDRPPRFDPLKHIERLPTIEHRPDRPLPPPADKYAEWAAQEDIKKDNVPWQSPRQ